MCLKELFSPITTSVRIFHSTDKKQVQYSKPKPEQVVVSWQHRGVGLGTSTSYISARVNRLNNIPTRGAKYGNVEQSIAAKPYCGKHIRMSTFAKAGFSDLNINGFIWLRVESSQQKCLFKCRKFIRSNKWKQYILSAPIASNANRIVFGITLMGIDKIWADEFQLTDKYGKKAKIVNHNFEQINSNNTPKSWNITSQGYTFTSVPNGYNGRCLLLEKEMHSFSDKLFAKTVKIGEKITKKLNSNLYCEIPLALTLDKKEEASKKILGSIPASQCNECSSDCK